jgi:hypothetical protein
LSCDTATASFARLNSIHKPNQFQPRIRQGVRSLRNCVVSDTADLRLTTPRRVARCPYGPRFAQPRLRVQPRPPAPRSAEIGFVLPESAQLGRGRDGDPRIASSPEIGFVLPDTAEPGGGGDRGPGVAARPARGLTVQCIEGLDGGLPSRQGAALVTVEPHQAQRDIVLAEPFGHDPVARAAHAQHVDLRLGDAHRRGVPRGARAQPGDARGEGGDLGRQRRVGEHRHAQPVAQGVAGDGGLAGARARTGAVRRIDAVGSADRGTGHAGSLCSATPPPPSGTSKSCVRVMGPRRLGASPAPAILLTYAAIRCNEIVA